MNDKNAKMRLIGAVNYHFHFQLLSKNFIRCAVDCRSFKSCRVCKVGAFHALALFVQLDWIEMWRPGQHLEPAVVAPPTIPELFLRRGRERFNAERGHRRQEMLFTLQSNKNGKKPRSSSRTLVQSITLPPLARLLSTSCCHEFPGHPWDMKEYLIIPLLRSPVLMFTYQLYALSVMDRGQHGQPD